MILINKTKQQIPSHHRAGGKFLHPGSNDIEDSTITQSERALIDALIRDGLVEEVEAPPESGTQVIPEAEAPSQPVMRVRRRVAPKAKTKAKKKAAARKTKTA